MKQITYKLALMYCFLLSSLLNGLSQNNEKTYKITDAYFDSTFTKSESRIEIIFINNKNKRVDIPIRLFYNSTFNTTSQDEYGNFQLSLKPGKYKFTFFFKKNQDLPYIIQDDYTVSTDSIQLNPSYQTIITVNLGDVKEQKSGEVVKKPQVYFYPKKNTEVNVKLNFNGKLNFTYPTYNNGWNFFAETNGSLNFKNKRYNYLFWDGESNTVETFINKNEGFIVNKKNLVSFLEDKLTKIGLNNKEQQDFITFWVPLMNQNEDIFIHFLFNESCNQVASLSITPKPDNFLRVYMVWSKANTTKSYQLKEQQIPSNKRNGFTVVEWGGVQLNEKIKIEL